MVRANAWLGADVAMSEAIVSCMGDASIQRKVRRLRV